MVNLELYKIFYTVSRCGSLTRAAEELHISQPAVSQAIKQLEAALGVTLFNRKHNGMELTSTGGELIFPDVEQALRLLGDAERHIAELKTRATGVLRIGASDTIFRYALADKIVEYNKRYPDVTIELISDVSPAIIEKLKNDSCDIGFLNLPIAVDNGIEIVDSIMHLNDIFIAGKKYAELNGKKLALSDMQQYSLLLMEEHTASREAFDEYTLSYGIKFAPSVEVDSWDFMKKLVVSGMGIGCIPREYVLNKLKDGSLFELDVSPRIPMRSVGMALQKHANISFAMKLFMDLAKR